jgi:uncharacterized MAPEG superfamily protein
MHNLIESVEVRMLVWSVVLGLVQLAIATTLATADQGLYYTLGIRERVAPPTSIVTERWLRAFRNFKETFVFFAAAVLAVVVLGRQSPVSAAGAQLYFWSRLVYVPIYVAGIPLARTAVWGLSIIGLAMVLAAAI